MTTPRTVVDESLPITRIVVTGDLNTERVVVDVDDQPRIAVSNTGEDITVNVYSTAAGVNSVNGLQGDITLTTSNIAEGTNLYYTTARVDSYVRGGELDSVRLDITPENTDAPVAGEIKYNTAYGVPQIGLPNDGTISLGIDQVAYVTNAEATTISKGQVVYLYGAQGDRASVKLAYNTSDATSSKTFGISKQDIAAGSAGYVVTQGIVSNLNLGAYQPGDILWLGSTPGSFTTTKAVAPAHLVFVGVVERANNGNGLIYVKPQNGYELDEIHDVLITSKSAGQVLRRNPDNTLWINDTLDTDDIGEGATNQYFTTARARGAISAGNNITITNGVISTVIEPDFTTVTVTEAPTDNYHVTNKLYVDSQVNAVPVLTSTDDLPEGSTNLYYTDARADARVAVGIAAIVDTAPETLDTLNELAAALGDDPNFATTVTNSIATKLATADFTSTANTWLGTKSTTNLAEGTNLYYTSTRANSDFDTRLATKSTSDLAEGSNLYYTDARVTTRLNNSSINELSDVVITTGTGGQLLYYNGSNWVNSAAVDSANLVRFSRTNSGTGNNTIMALSRNRADAARAVDQGPWLGFEYVGTDNTQATSPQSAIRSLYEAAGNHKLQVMQLPGNYTSPTVVAQIQRGNTFFNNTSGGNMLLLTDTAATIRGTTTTITNSANTTTYATFASTGTSILGAGLHTLTRTTVGTPGVTESRPSFNIQLTRTDQATPSNNDGTGFRYRVAGSNGTNYTVADMTATYATNGDAAWFLNLANGDQTGSTFTGVGIIQSKVSSTTIRAGTPSATPGGSSVADKLIVDANKVTSTVPVAYPSYTTTQRDALTPSPGWVLWNSTDTKLQVYTGSGWSDLH